MMMATLRTQPGRSSVSCRAPKRSTCQPRCCGPMLTSAVTELRTLATGPSVGIAAAVGSRPPEIPRQTPLMIFRLSAKLNAKIDSGPLKPLPQDVNPFGDWSADLFVADRAQYLLCCNTRLLYSAVMFAKGIANDSFFIERVLSNIRETLEADGQEFVYHRFIVPATGSVRFSKALNRSVIGSMTDLIRH